MRVKWQPWIVALAAAGIVAGCETTESATSGPGATSGATETGSPTPPPPPPPPSPPPPAETAAEPSMDSVAVTSSRGRGAVDEMVAEASPITGGIMAEKRATDIIAPGPLPKPVPRPDQPEPQAGMLTAADYDDVLNPGLYKIYLDRMLQGELNGKDLPYVDANQRITIEVTDRLGKPVPLARVSMTTSDGQPMFPLRTGANGKAYLYPSYDDLEAGMTVSVASEGAQTLSQTLSEQNLSDGGVMSFDLSKDVYEVQKLDLLLTLDATGSMSDEMRYLQVELVAILDRLKDANPNLDIRAGFIVYRDKGDAYVVRDVPFTGDLQAFKDQLSEQSAQGGGDFPEAMQDAMKLGLDFEWREDAIKVNMLVADAPPHDGDISATWDSALISRSRGIHIVPLAASGVDKTAEFLMRGMAQMTNGRFMFLTDDSGIGNPHAEPTVDCYAVTRLDGLVQRVLESLITGVRAEPDGDDVIRTVGNYRLGVCELDQPQES